MAYHIYKTTAGIIVQQNNDYFDFGNINWDAFINNDNLYAAVAAGVLTADQYNKPHNFDELILPPVESQEVWACGVTYFRSKVGREEESKESGASDFYAKVYEAERPEIFFKAIPSRTVGHLGHVRIRKDSSWNVPEPELTLVTSSSGKIVGYTIGNDMSSRSIEGENPLYLPQAKMYEGSTAVGPCVYVSDQHLDSNTKIHLQISRAGKTVFDGHTAISEMKRSFAELVSYVYSEMKFPNGCLIMTGTGIVPGHDFTLLSGDMIRIKIDNIGVLSNTVE